MATAAMCGPSGFGDCDGNTNNGCEANLAADTHNCGACGSVCPSGFSCVSGVCSDGDGGYVCASGYGDCDGNINNGCETDLSFDSNNCGACGSACASGFSCTNGICSDGDGGYVCPSGFGDCDKQYRERLRGGPVGRYVQLRSLRLDVRDRNVLRQRHVAPMATAATCARRATRIATTTPPTAGETDLVVDAANCGACGQACASGMICSWGACVVGQDGGVCSGTFADCNNNSADGCEVNLATDPNNCGSCGQACMSGFSCSAGACTDGDAGVCNTSLQCPNGQVCVDHQCVVDSDGGTCTSGYADCDNDTSNGCETYVETDTSNCGSCGNVCTTGYSCVSGICTAPATCGFSTTCTGCEVLASGQTAPHPVVIDSGYVYWGLDAGGVYRKAKSGGSVALLGTGPGAPFHMAIDSSTVYWTHPSPNGVSKVPVGGGTVATVNTDLGMASSSAGRFAIAVDSTNVWYDANGVLGFTPKAGGTASGYNLGGPITFAGIALDTDYAYGVDLGFNGGDGSVMKVNKTTGATQTLAASEAMPVTVAYSGGYVYWAGQDNGTIKRIPATGGSATVIASGQEPSIHYIAVDGTNVYWGSSAGYIKKAPVGGGTATVVASGKVCPTDLAVDGTHVYWANRATGEIVRAAK